MSKNKVISAQIFRWLECKKYSIKVERKNGVHLYTDVSLKTAMNLYKALFRTTLHFSSSCDKHSVQGDFVRLAKPLPLKVYFVQVGIDGYMPNMTSAYPTLEAAIKAAQEEKQFMIDAGYTVRGNIRSNWCYEVLSEGKYYHTSIRIESYNVLDCGVSDFSHVTNRAVLDQACDEYNQNN